jgi:hypothetical protein
MTINSDVISPAPGEESDGAFEFLKSFKVDEPKAPSEGDEEPKRRPQPDQAEEDQTDDEEVETEDDESPSEESQDDEGEGEEEDKRLWIEDETNVHTKVEVDGKQIDVPIANLKRLYGQEAALTQRSQQLSATRQKLEGDQQSHLAVANAFLAQAEKKLEPYLKLDFLALARDQRVTPEQLQALREEANARWEEVQFLKQHQGKFVEALQEQTRAQMKVQAEASTKMLTDPADPNYIEGWGPQTYDSLRQFAVKQGVPAPMVNDIVLAPVIKLLHMALQYSLGKQTAQVQTIKKDKQVKKVIKTSRRAPEGSTGPGSAKVKAVAKLRRTGSQDDAAEAFLAGFQEHSDQ